MFEIRSDRHNSVDRFGIQSLRSSILALDPGAKTNSMETRGLDKIHLANIEQGREETREGESMDVEPALWVVLMQGFQ